MAACGDVTARWQNGRDATERSGRSHEQREDRKREPSGHGLHRVRARRCAGGRRSRWDEFRLEQPDKTKKTKKG